jgi:pyrroline-5-carboxylate reductase
MEMAAASWSPEWTLGFLGTGKISSAVCTGYCTLPPEQRPRKILISERSTEKSAALAARFPEIVEVVADNEDIVRRSDVVFIGLLPAVAREVLPVMPWENCKLIVSMMAAVNYETVGDCELLRVIVYHLLGFSSLA